MTTFENNPSARQIWLLNAGLATLYIAVAWLSGQLFAAYGLEPPPIWSAAAITMSAVWYLGRYAWPGILLGSLVGHLLTPGYEGALPVAILASAGELAGAYSALRMLNPKPDAMPPFGRMKHLVRFLLGAGVLFPIIAATVGTVAYAVVHGVVAQALFFVWLKWSIADAAGVLLFSPLLMMILRRKPSSRIRLTTESAAALIATTILAIWIYWFADRNTFAVYALPYLLALPLAWAALKFDLRIAIVILLAKESVALFGTLQGAGALNATGDPHPLDTLNLIILATSVSVYVVNVLVNELRHQHRSQRQANRYLAAQVEERTEKLAASEARFRSYFNAGLIGLAEIAPDGRWALVNNHLRYLLGYTQEELAGMSFHAIVHEAERALNMERFGHICSGRLEAYTLEVNLVRKNGQAIPALLSARAARRKDGTLDFIFVVVDDITQHKAMEAELKRQATVDYLTGLSNRRHFTDLAVREIERAERHGSDLAFMIFDIDRFKAINDKYGHPTGDVVLKRVAERCLESLRSIDIVGRVGGEEFAVMLPDTGQAGATEIAERLRRMIAELHQVHDGTPFIPAITISIGLAILRPGEKLEPLFSRADAALYRAKEGGRNRVEVATQPWERDMAESVHLGEPTDSGSMERGKTLH